MYGQYEGQVSRAFINIQESLIFIDSIVNIYEEVKIYHKFGTPTNLLNFFF